MYSCNLQKERKFQLHFTFFKSLYETFGPHLDTKLSEMFIIESRETTIFVNLDLPSFILFPFSYEGLMERFLKKPH